MPAITHPHHQNGEATEAHSSLLALGHRSNCPNSFQGFLPSHATSRVRPHFLAPSPASPVRQRRPAPSSGRRRAEGAADPAPRGPAHLAARLPLAATAGRGGNAVLPLDSAPVHPALAMVTTLGPPGEFQIPPPPAAPLPSCPGPQHSVGGPAPPSPVPAAPPHPRSRVPGGGGSPGRGLGSSARSLGVAADAEPLSSSTPPNLTPSLPRKVRCLEGVPGTQWLAAPCTAALAHLGRGPAGSGCPTRCGWAERARGLLRPPPGGPREGRRVSSSLRGGGVGREDGGAGAVGPG